MTLDERGQAPEEGPVDPHEHLGVARLSALFRMILSGTRAFSWRKSISPAPDPRPAWWGQDDEDEVRSVDEPLAHAAEGVALGRGSQMPGWADSHIPQAPCPPSNQTILRSGLKVTKNLRDFLGF